jgi:hypothetical protein
VRITRKAVNEDSTTVPGQDMMFIVSKKNNDFKRTVSANNPYNLGIYDCVLKPASIETLFDTLKSILQIRVTIQ